MIRRAKVKDAETVHAVLLAAREEIPLTRNFADDAYKNWVRDKCRDRRVWIFESDGEAAGVMVMSGSEIFYLVTSPTHRKCGVAQALVEDAQARVWKRNRTTARGRVRPENLSVVRLLEKLDFAVDHDMVTPPGWVWYTAKPPPLRRRLGRGHEDR
ncbi:GNAT family N-acetyltransferase [Roseiarcus sp.]|uniref:GNAT family N-acetyltransferase n=1 Tax=Roseiarcus sp. TaxID=1969460 RepID=UPI003F96CB90